MIVCFHRVTVSSALLARKKVSPKTMCLILFSTDIQLIGKPCSFLSRITNTAIFVFSVTQTHIELSYSWFKYMRVGVPCRGIFCTACPSLSFSKMCSSFAEVPTTKKCYIKHEDSNPKYNTYCLFPVIFKTCDIAVEIFLSTDKGYLITRFLYLFLLHFLILILFGCVFLLFFCLEPIKLENFKSML